MSCSNESDYKTRFANDWRNAVDHKAYLDIAGVLMANKIKDSQRIYLKEDLTDTNKFMLAFTDDQKAYRYYLIDLRPASIKPVTSADIPMPKDMLGKLADDLPNSITESELKNKTTVDAYVIITGSFEGNPSKSQVQPMLEDVMKSHGLEITDENINKTSSALVSMRLDSKIGVTEMEILKHVYQNGSPDQPLPTDIAISAYYLEKTK